MGEKGEIISNSYLSLLSTPKNDGSFNVYDDVRNKLVEKGVPKEEIVYIHEATTESKKSELFEKIRKGQVRILMGSTQKMGAGTNVQDRLVALHHLDVPWRPADLQQQEGRILRQGNRNKKVKIFRYVTENTFDAFMWQTLEKKQKFISQIMTSKSPVRVCEDLDGAALDYAEVKALCSGSPLIKEKMQLDTDVARLRMMQAQYRSQIYSLESDIAKKYPVQISDTKILIKKMKDDLPAAKCAASDNFLMVVNGIKYEDKKEAGEAILSALSTSKGEIGEYCGFTLSSDFNLWSQSFVLTVRRMGSHSVELGKDPLGNIKRIHNLLASLPDKLSKLEDKLSILEQQFETAKEEVKKPFQKAAELESKVARLNELNILLDMEQKGMDINRDTEEVPSCHRENVSVKERRGRIMV